MRTVKDIKDKIGDKINEYRIQENAELQKMVTESNAAMASAIEQQNTAVSTMANANMDGGGGQPEDVSSLHLTSSSGMKQIHSLFLSLINLEALNLICTAHNLK